MAGPIKLFQFIQKCHQTIGISPFRPNQKQRLTNLIQTILLISLAQFMLTTAAFALFDAKSMFEYGFAFYSFVTMINCIAIYLILIWQSQNTLEFIKSGEAFIAKRTHSAAAYNDFIEKLELFNKFLSFEMCTIVILLAFSVVPYSFVRYYIFDMAENSFYLFFPAWYPFDWKTPVGYLVACSWQCAAAVAVGCVISHFLNLVFGSCWLFIFIAKDITQDVAAFNIAAKTVSNENRVELMKRLCDVVQIYSDAKQCVLEFNHVFKYSLFTFFAWDMSSVSSLLVTIQFELWADASNSLEIALLTVVLIWVFLFIFLLCEPGERITNQFDALSSVLSGCDWHLLTDELQRCYIIFLSDTQSPVKVMSYVNIVCERETSKKMINKAFSYFMTFRRFKP